MKKRMMTCTLALLLLAGAALGALPRTAAAAGIPSVTLLDPSNVGETSAQINAYVTCASANVYAETGFYMGKSESGIRDNRYARSNAVRKSSFALSFKPADIKAMYGSLQAGTVYYYKMFVVVNGEEYTSPTGWFRTAGDAPGSKGGAKPVFDLYEPLELTMDGAMLGARITSNPYGLEFSRVGLLLGKSANALGEAASFTPTHKTLPEIWVQTAKYRPLDPLTSYCYQFYAMTKSGACYVSAVKSFTTLAPTYTVYFNANGGVLDGVGDMRVTPGQYYAIQSVPTLAGFVFEGWYTNPVGGSRVEQNGVWPHYGDMTVYAHWIQNNTGKELQLYFDLNYDNLGAVEMKVVQAGAKYGTLPAPEREGYKLSGWYTAQENGAQVTAATRANAGGTQVLYALWAPRSYKITFNPNGGSVSPKSSTLVYGETYTLPVPTRAGYTFANWATAKTGGDRIPAVWTMDIPSKATFYAVWEAEAGNMLPQNQPPVG